MPLVGRFGLHLIDMKFFYIAKYSGLINVNLEGDKLPYNNPFRIRSKKINRKISGTKLTCGSTVGQEICASVLDCRRII